MRCKGKDGHEMSDGQKFCATCGSGAEETLAKSVCGGCHAEGAGDQKFCAQCGEPMAKAADFDAGMAALEDLYTTTRQTPDELTVEEHSWGTPQVGDLLKGQGADGVIDAAPVLDAVLESSNRVADQVVAGNRQSVKLERALGVIAKAIVTVVRPLMAEVKALRDEMQTQGNQRLPRRGQVELVHKAMRGAFAGHLHIATGSLVPRVVGAQQLREIAVHPRALKYPDCRVLRVLSIF